MKKSTKPKEGATKKSPTSKSQAENTKETLRMATDQMYQIALKSIISSAVPHCPKEILIEISKFINIIYLKLEDHCLNTVMPNDTVKRRELGWENVTKKVQEVLLPLLQAVNTEQKPLLQVPSPFQEDQVLKGPHQAERMANNIIKIEPLLENNHSGSGHTLNHAIKAYAQCHSVEKKIAKYTGPSL